MVVALGALALPCVASGFPQTLLLQAGCSSYPPARTNSQGSAGAPGQKQAKSPAAFARLWPTCVVRSFRSQFWQGKEGPKRLRAIR